MATNLTSTMKISSKNSLLTKKCKSFFSAQIIFIFILSTLVFVFAFKHFFSSDFSEYRVAYRQSHFDSLIQAVQHDMGLSQRVQVGPGTIASVFIKLATYANNNINCKVSLKLISDAAILRESSKECSDIIDNQFNSFNIDQLELKDKQDLVLRVENTGDQSNSIAVYYITQSQGSLINIESSDDKQETIDGALSVVMGRVESRPPPAKLFIIITVLFILFSTTIYTILANRNIEDKRKWVLVIFLIGLGYVFLVPPFNFSDEHEHFTRILQLSEINIHAISARPFQTDLEFVSVMNNTLWSDDHLSGGVLSETVSELYNTDDVAHHRSDERVEARSLAGAYFPSTHLPQAIFLAFLRLFQIPTLMYVYLLRVFTLILFLSLGLISMWMAPKYLNFWIGVMLLPSVISQAAAISIDSFAIGLVMISVAGILTKKKSMPLSIGLIISLTLLSFTKFIFFPISLLSFYQYFCKPKPRVIKIALLFLFSVVFILTSFVWLKNSSDDFSTDPRFPMSNPKTQLINSVRDPINTTTIFLSSIFQDPIYTIENATGSIWTNYKQPNVNILLISHSILFLLLLMSYSKRIRMACNTTLSLLALGSVILIIFGYFAVLYLYATNLGAQGVNIPPRYITSILPATIFFASLFSYFGCFRTKEDSSSKIIATMSAVTIISLYFQYITFTSIWV